MTIRFAFALALAPCLAFVACQEPEPVSPVVGLTEPVDPPTFPVLDNYPERDITVHLYLMSSIRKFCAGADPFFHFDSDRVSAHDQPSLYSLAVCLKTGALKDSRIELSGRTDPRGSVPYNEKLGLERAERVKAFLVGQGVATGRLVTSSLGKSGAEPGEDKWGTDRRVDIELLP
jgi:outer membrane protein OmpA-like peptidoglycan-associated protein